MLWEWRRILDRRRLPVGRLEFEIGGRLYFLFLSCVVVTIIVIVDVICFILAHRPGFEAVLRRWLFSSMKTEDLKAMQIPFAAQHMQPLPLYSVCLYKICVKTFRSCCHTATAINQRWNILENEPDVYQPLGMSELRRFRVALCPAKCSFHIVVQLCSLDPHLLQYFVCIGDEFLEHFFHHIYRVGVDIFLRVILGMLIILVLLHRGLDSGTRGCLFPSRGSFNRTTAM